jgi:hypothetical protein
MRMQPSHDILNEEKYGKEITLRGFHEMIT